VGEALGGGGAGRALTMRLARSRSRSLFGLAAAIAAIALLFAAIGVAAVMTIRARIQERSVAPHVLLTKDRRDRPSGRLQPGEDGEGWNGLEPSPGGIIGTVRDPHLRDRAGSWRRLPKAPLRAPGTGIQARTTGGLLSGCRPEARGSVRDLFSESRTGSEFEPVPRRGMATRLRHPASRPALAHSGSLPEQRGREGQPGPEGQAHHVIALAELSAARDPLQH
jgi:hypothetical protein